MANTFSDPHEALEQMRKLNDAEGEGTYTVCWSVDGEYQIRRIAPAVIPRTAEFVKLKNWVRQLAYGNANAVRTW